MEAEALAPVVVEANTLPNHETRWLWRFQQQQQQQLWERQKVSITAGKQALAGEESQRSDREATGYNRFVNSARHSGGRA